MHRALALMLVVGAFSGCRCGTPASYTPDAGQADAGPRCGSDSDCPLGQACVGGRCGLPVAPDASVPACVTFADCPVGQVCIPSTNTCYAPPPDDGGETDAGYLGSCLPGQ